MIGSLRLEVAEADKPAVAVLVPLSAIVQAKDQGFGVFVVAASNDGAVARLRPVQTGRVVGMAVTVVSGLGNGDEVITTGANLLKDGQRVEVVKDG
jgi:multidrug efflux system membrane fusion protein